MKTISKTIFSTAAVIATVSGAVIAPVAEVSAWGDNGGNRRGYTINEIEHDALGNKVVFNSITNGKYTDKNGKVHELGDERNFVRTRLSGTNNVWSSNEITVEDGKEYVVSLYVHNNNPKGTDVVAENTTVSFSIPGNSASSVQVDGTITSSNATPSKYWDDVVFKTANGANFHLEYIKDSALWESNGKSAGALSNDIITSKGVKVGYDALDGKIPGCYQYSGYASVRVKAVFDNTFEISKQVRIKGTTTWSESVDAKVGDVVEYMIGYENVSGKTVSDVLVQDTLPSNMEYVAKSTKLMNTNHPTAVEFADGITEGGINIGAYDNDSNAYVLFEAKVVDKDLACNKTTNVKNIVKITAGNVTKTDDASVLVAKTCKDDPVDPTDPVLPKTGPADVITGALGAGSIVTALGYFIASRKKLM